MTTHSSHVQSKGFVLRRAKGSAAAFALFARVMDAGTSLFSPGTGSRFAALVLCVIVFGLTAAALAFAIGADGFTQFASGLAAFPVIGKTAVQDPPPERKSGTEPKKPAKIREMEANLKALAKELEEAQSEMATGPISQERGEEIEQKAMEMEQLQDHIDRYNRIAGITKKGREVGQVSLPEDERYERKSIHTTPGHLFVASEAFATYRRQGKQGWSAKVEMNAPRFGKRIRLVGEQARAFEKKAFDPAQLSDLGTDAIIEVDRDRELVRFEEPEILTIRDVLTVVPTTSDSIKFVRHVATTRAAASQNPKRGGLKPLLKIEFEPDTTPVETIAVLSKVTEQDIDDAPRLVGYINGEMSLDVKVVEEEQLLWGTGANSQLKGLFHADHAIPEFDRAAVDDTLIDTIRKMRTDLRKGKRVVPNFVAIDPLDWETIELEKGTDERYLWGLITDLRGPRIWSLRVVESDGMTNPDTGERRILMGDGVRGATVYNRNDIRLAVGFMDDDFARNLRTLRAEERLALAVKRPFAFEYTVTAEGES